jgi:hypothetical protein
MPNVAAPTFTTQGAIIIILMVRSLLTNLSDSDGNFHTEEPDIELPSIV